MEQENTAQNVGLDFFRIKTEWTTEGENGVLTKKKTEELVMAANYSAAEKVAYAIAEGQRRGKFGEFTVEIIKTKITDVLFNDILAQDDEMVEKLICNYFDDSEDSGVGLYSVKVVYIIVEEKSGKTKRTNQTFYVPATSNADATQRIDAYLKQSMVEYVVRDTKFDKAEAIYWPADVHQRKVKAADLEQ